MSNEIVSDRVIDEMITRLLAKTEKDEQMEIDLYGYPADFLDSAQLKGARVDENVIPELIDGNDYVGFEILRFKGDETYVGSVLANNAPLYLLDFGVKKAYINTKKLRSLLYSHSNNGVIKSTMNGDVFYININKQLLLDSTEA